MPLFFTDSDPRNPLRRNPRDLRSAMRPAQQTLPVFKVRGTDRKSAIPGRLPAVQSMNSATKAALLKQALNYHGTGQSYAKLSPGNPVHPNKGSLVFVAPDIIDCGLKLARYKGSKNGSGRQMLWVRADAGRQYLVDCIVGTHYTPSNFKIEGPGVSQTVYSAFADDMGKKRINNIATDHLHFVLQAQNTAWYGFALWNLSVTWFFFSCEVTQL